MPRGNKKPKKCIDCPKELEQPTRGRTRIRCKECSYKRKLDKDRKRLSEQRLKSKYHINVLDEMILERASKAYKERIKIDEDDKERYDSIWNRKLQPEHLLLQRKPLETGFEFKQWNKKEIQQLIDERIYTLLKVMIKECKYPSNQ